MLIPAETTAILIHSHSTFFGPSLSFSSGSLGLIEFSFLPESRASLLYACYSAEKSSS